MERQIGVPELADGVGLPRVVVVFRDTRLPGYLRTKIGVIETVYRGAYLYADNVPTDGICTPQPVYLVKFKTRDIWSDVLDRGDVLYNDCFEVYLEAANKN